MPADAGIINARHCSLWAKPREKPLETRGFDPHLVRSEAVRMEAPQRGLFLGRIAWSRPEADGSKKFNGGVDTQNGFGLYTAH
jgi:hypothetical protein